MDDLMPCPFCGKTAIHCRDEANKYGAVVRTYARCPDDDCAGRVSWMPIEMWNRRPTPRSSQEEPPAGQTPLDEAMDHIVSLLGVMPPAKRRQWPRMMRTAEEFVTARRGKLCYLPEPAAPQEGDKTNQGGADAAH